MVGLSASELQAETLFPGDTVEYFSMAFVAGDPRGHRVAKVLGVDRQDDEFPVRVDTEEMLPLTIMLKRKRDRNGLEISSEDAKWRKLRTYKLVDGEVEGETRADRLNAGLKKGLSEAMKSTKKRLAGERAEKANAGSKKVMSMFLMGAADEGETTSSQRSSLEKTATPERQKKGKPLSPRDNSDYSPHRRSHDRDVPRKSRVGEKSPLKLRHEDRTVQSERQPKYESSKYESLKRKRSDSTSTKPRRTDAIPRKNQKSISKYFEENKPRHSKMRTSIDLNKFMHHAEEIDEIEDIEKKKKKHTIDLNEYMALDAKQQRVVKTVKEKLKSESGGGDTNGSGRPDTSEKKAWNERRTQFRRTNNAPNTLQSWLKPPVDKRKGDLEDVSGGTPHQQRRLNLVAAKPKSPKMSRKDGLSFMMSNRSGDASYQKEAKGSKHRETPPSKQDNQPRKLRGSLGTVSARAPKTLNLTGKWNHRKPVR